MVEGEVSMGGQEHFYLETHASLAVPRGEDGEMELFVSTQNPTETQVCNASGCLKLKLFIKTTRHVLYKGACIAKTLYKEEKDTGGQNTLCQ